jgi:regulator of sirC expression with transglutaminase-like and TPR domain
MHTRFPLPDWNDLAASDDRTVPLLGTALLIARDEYPQLDADLYDTMLQSHVEHLRAQVDAVDAWPQKMAAINRHLFDELGYAGDSEHYYDPRNSYINEVFDRRLGNPISLALVQIEVARRLGVPLDGVSFPGHFLVRLPVDDGVLVMDPFNRGRPLDEDELRQRARPHLNGEAPDDRALFQILNPATHRAILVRVLRNLHGVYTERDDWERAARSADRMLRLSPDNGDALRDRALAYMKMGYRQGARADLARYLQLHPDASDSGPLRERLVELSSGPARTN